MKRVLVIAYYFPPLGMGGVRRVVNFCRYLPEFGWNPLVLTVKPIRYFTYDPELMKEIECEVQRSESADPLRIMRILNIGKEFDNIRSRSQELSNFLFIPDNKIGWLPFAVSKGIQMIKDVDVILATAPPYTGLLIGCMLKRINGVPLVVEFRDPWPYWSYATLFHKRVNEWLKRRVLNLSDAIISVNEPIKASLWSLVSGLKSQVTVIPSGWSPEVMTSPDDFRFETEKPDKFTIVYTGSFIPPRTPVYFLKALSGLISEGKIKPNDIRVELIGFSQGETIIKELELEEIVRVESYRPHRYCVERLKKADLLWVMIDEVEKASTGKIGEYLGARKPILATVPEGPCADIIRETKSGIVVPPRDIEAIKEAIYDFYLKFKRGKLESPLEEEVKEYSWVKLTGRLAQIFDNLATEIHKKNQKNVDK